MNVGSSKDLLALLPRLVPCYQRWLACRLDPYISGSPRAALTSSQRFPLQHDSAATEMPVVAHLLVRGPHEQGLYTASQGLNMTAFQRHSVDQAPAKVAAVTVGFWIAKVAATTLGETGGDWVTMSLGLGYLVGSAIFAAAFAALVLGQVSTSRFHPALYWATIVATTTLGTTLADFFDRSLGAGYLGGTSVIAALLIISLFVWHRVEGSRYCSSRPHPASMALRRRPTLAGSSRATARTGRSAFSTGPQASCYRLSKPARTRTRSSTNPRRTGSSPSTGARRTSPSSMHSR